MAVIPKKPDEVTLQEEVDKLTQQNADLQQRIANLENDTPQEVVSALRFLKNLASELQQQEFRTSNIGMIDYKIEKVLKRLLNDNGFW